MIKYKEIFTARDASVAQSTSVEFHTSHGHLGVHLGKHTCVYLSSLFPISHNHPSLSYICHLFIACIMIYFSDCNSQQHSFLFFLACLLACQTWQSCHLLEYKRSYWKSANARGLGGNYSSNDFLIIKYHCLK